MWGSNYPAHPEAYGSLPDSWALGQRDLSFLSEADRRLVFGDNALRLWPDLRG
jgi:predicted TIM-barrel fold metal-dependent hydrolase